MELTGNLYETDKYLMIYAQPESVNKFVERILKRYKKDLINKTQLTSIIWKADGDKMYDYYKNNRIKFNKILKKRAINKFSEIHEDYITFNGMKFDVVEI